jgi:hypothetical protein
VVKSAPALVVSAPAAAATPRPAHGVKPQAERHHAHAHRHAHRKHGVAERPRDDLRSDGHHGKPEHASRPQHRDKDQSHRLERHSDEHQTTTPAVTVPQIPAVEDPVGQDGDRHHGEGKSRSRQEP